MLAGQDNEILSRLEEQRREEGGLPPLLEFYQRLLRAQSEAAREIGVPGVDLTAEIIADRMESGQPLIAFDELDLDWSSLHGIFEKVVSIFADYPELFGQLPEALKEPERFLSREAVKAWFEDSGLPPEILADNAGRAMIENIIHATLNPVLESCSNALRSYIDPERWRRRYCPLCGGIPDFAFLDKESGARWLLCSRCNTEWLFQRLECPCCGATDQNALAYFTDDKGLYRLYVCEQCKQYLKAIDLRQAGSEVLLPLERLLTLDIDAQAREYGYSPCGMPITSG